MSDFRITWIPTQQYGETFYLCRVEALNVMAEAHSRSKRKALVFALEELARLVDVDTAARDGLVVPS